MAIQESDMPWFSDLASIIEQNASNPHFDVYEAAYQKAKEMQEHGATAILFYNSSTNRDGMEFRPKDVTETLQIPVIYLLSPTMEKHFKDRQGTYDIKLKVETGPKFRYGTNVIGYVDNNAANTIVLGAHFDHLGTGEDGNSMMRGAAGQVHNGADDNASGTAALIELARLLKSSGIPSHNYLFVAFSGEELGLLGSKYFVEHPTIDLKQVNYMINMDMLGRLNDSTRTITVGGYGTSPFWGVAYQAKGKNALFQEGLKFRFDSSGTGPSDHTSFYRKGIPVAFYFTGLHQDYHRPEDDADKINYQGLLQIVKHIYSVIQSSGKHKEKIAFTKTREVQISNSARFSVSLGIMPDYSFHGEGVRVDGVSENRPAKKAGLKTGDIIILLGEHKINSMESYMQALSKFKKGDNTTVTWKRGEERFSSPVEF
jgi:hypothetical protein